MSAMPTLLSAAVSYVRNLPESEQWILSQPNYGLMPGWEGWPLEAVKAVCEANVRNWKLAHAQDSTFDPNNVEIKWSDKDNGYLVVKLGRRGVAFLPEVLGMLNEACKAGSIERFLARPEVQKKAAEYKARHEAAKRKPGRPAGY